MAWYDRVHAYTCMCGVQESVVRAVAANPTQFVKATKSGTAATEEMLDAVHGHYKL